MSDDPRPDTDGKENLPSEYQEVPTPDPHRTEPAPAPEEGMRPGVDPAVRPEQDEPLGPVAGLVGAVDAKVSDEAAALADRDDPEAEALLAQMGVEEEGIEGGQLLGLVAAVLVSVALLAGTLIYAFYLPYRAAVGERAEAGLNAQELAVVQTEGQAKILAYTRTDSTYQVPIGRAMGLVAAEYAAGGGVGADSVRDRQPRSRQEWNTLPVRQSGPLAAVQETPVRGEVNRAPGPAPGPTLGPAADGVEEVGVDRVVPPVELIDDADEAIE